MKEYSSKDIRNVVLIGSAKSGKTTLSEAMLYEGKVFPTTPSSSRQTRSPFMQLRFTLSS